MPVSGAAGGCLLEAASAAGNLLITLRYTQALGGAALAGQGPVNNTRSARVQAPPAELWARTAARSLVRVGVHIIDLHVAAIHKLLKLRFDRMSVGGSRTGPLRAATGRRRGELPSRRRFAFVSGRGVALLCCVT